MASLLKFIPNSLSLLRVLLLFPLVYYVKLNNFTAIIALSALMIASDYLDGFLARKWKATTVTGRVLDPVADKICIIMLGIALALFKGFPFYLLIALVLRDLIILSAGLFSIKRLKAVPQSNIIGKITVGVISACMLAFLFDIEFLKLPTVVAVAASIPVSLFSYGLELYRKYKFLSGKIPPDLNK
ncbi:MAG: CDP-alcohol phosphatidyltransferase family protein [Candidatus Zixiibacteriota bacterium]|nr:MAG: CDP-alcohol phosphatidyltransferase family protein [candidate division Zixibacteria bacterium]